MDSEFGLFHVLLCSALDGERESWLLYFVYLPGVFDCYCSVALPHFIVGWSAVCLFDLILYIPVNNFSAMSRWVFLG